MEAQSQDRSSRLDWGRIEAWAQQFSRGDLGQVSAVFEANGDLAPHVLWQPTSSQIQTPQLRFLLDYWAKLRADARLPGSRSVNLALAPISGSLVDVVDDGRDFRVRRCGAALLALAGYDLTGRLVSEYAIGSSPFTSSRARSPSTAPRIAEASPCTSTARRREGSYRMAGAACCCHWPVAPAGSGAFFTAPFRSAREGCRSLRGFSAEIARQIAPARCAGARARDRGA